MSVETIRGHRSRGIPYVGEIAICWECYSLSTEKRHPTVFDPRDAHSVLVLNRAASMMLRGNRFNVDPRARVIDWFPGAPTPEQSKTKYLFDGKMQTGREIYDSCLQKMETYRDIFCGELPISMVKGNQPFWVVHYRDAKDVNKPGDVGVVTYGMATEIWINGGEK